MTDHIACLQSTDNLVSVSKRRYQMCKSLSRPPFLFACSSHRETVMVKCGMGMRCSGCQRVCVTGVCSGWHLAKISAKAEGLGDGEGVRAAVTRVQYECLLLTRRLLRRKLPRALLVGQERLHARHLHLLLGPQKSTGILLWFWCSKYLGTILSIPAGLMNSSASGVPITSVR